MPPHSKAPPTTLEAVAAEGIVVTDGDAPGPLVVREMRCGEEGGSTDPRYVARWGGQRTSITGIQATGHLGHGVDGVTMGKSNMRGYPQKFNL